MHGCEVVVVGIERSICVRSLDNTQLFDVDVEVYLQTGQELVCTPPFQDTVARQGQQVCR
jgi:hypothetical protein